MPYCSHRMLPPHSTTVNPWRSIPEGIVSALDSGTSTGSSTGAKTIYTLITVSGSGYTFSFAHSLYSSLGKEIRL